MRGVNAHHHAVVVGVRVAAQDVAEVVADDRLHVGVELVADPGRSSRPSWGCWRALNAVGRGVVLVDDELAVGVDPRGARHVVAVADVRGVDVRDPEGAGQRQVRGRHVALSRVVGTPSVPNSLRRMLVLLAVALHQVEVLVPVLGRPELPGAVVAQHEVGGRARGRVRQGQRIGPARSLGRRLPGGVRGELDAGGRRGAGGGVVRRDHVAGGAVRGGELVAADLRSVGDDGCLPDVEVALVTSTGVEDGCVSTAHRRLHVDERVRGTHGTVTVSVVEVAPVTVAAVAPPMVTVSSVIVGLKPRPVRVAVLPGRGVTGRWR